MNTTMALTLIMENQYSKLAERSYAARIHKDQHRRDRRLPRPMQACAETTTAYR